MALDTGEIEHFPIYILQRTVPFMTVSVCVCVEKCIDNEKIPNIKFMNYTENCFCHAVLQKKTPGKRHDAIGRTGRTERRRPIAT